MRVVSQQNFLFRADGYEFFERRKNSIIETISNEKEEYILNVNETEFIRYLLSEYTIPVPTLNKEELWAEEIEREIPAEQHPAFQYHLTRGMSSKQPVIKFHLPFTGDKALFGIRPSTYTTGMSPARVEETGICFEIIRFNQTPEQLNLEAESIIKQFSQQLVNLKSDIDKFNQGLQNLIVQEFNKRKTELLNKNQFLAALKVPIRKSSNTPSTFSIPTKRTPLIVTKPKPEVHDKGFQPDPTLDDQIYDQILKVIFDVGRQIERHPKTYVGKDEEALRDHFLTFLEPNFEGSATGETFNAEGKTDILMRYDGGNVFIAEFKFWHGSKKYLEAISQLLTYLTWRDSKVAIAIFVNNKEISNVLETISTETSKHQNYLGFVKNEESGWLRYRFHINGDRNREVKLSVMIFHLPKNE